MNLAHLFVLTDRMASERAGRPLLQTLELALDGGAPAIVLREKDLPLLERRELAFTSKELTASAGARLIIASDAALAIETEASAVHLTSRDAVPAGIAFGQSCHSPAGCDVAQQAGAQYATLSPIFETPSKPGYGPALGPSVFHRLRCSMPVLALGGVHSENAARCIAEGAQGIAVMGAIMGARDPAQAAEQILKAIS